MKPVFSMLSQMASDKRVSDIHFREAIVKLFEGERRSDPFDTVLRALYQDAIYETERDRYVK